MNPSVSTHCVSAASPEILGETLRKIFYKKGGFSAWSCCRETVRDNVLAHASSPVSIPATQISNYAEWGIHSLVFSPRIYPALLVSKGQILCDLFIRLLRYKTKHSWPFVQLPVTSGEAERYKWKGLFRNMQTGEAKAHLTFCSIWSPLSNPLIYIEQIRFVRKKREGVRLPGWNQLSMRIVLLSIGKTNTCKKKECLILDKNYDHFVWVLLCWLRNIQKNPTSNNIWL